MCYGNTEVGFFWWNLIGLNSSVLLLSLKSHRME